MLQQITIGKRLFIGFFIVLLFVMVVAAAGQWALTSTVATAEQVLTVDFAINSAANDVHVAVLDLRRFEKDLFLNIGDKQKETDYVTKWEAARRTLDENLNALEQVDRDEQERTTIREIRANVAIYVPALQQIAQQIADGKIKTPNAANAAITTTPRAGCGRRRRPSSTSRRTPARSPRSSPASRC
jgi:methyl-accepting chemotaxis protein